MDADDAVQFDSEMQWGVDVLVGSDDVDQYGATTSPADGQTTSSAYNASYHAGAFSPIYEDQSPGSDSGPDSGSSPVGPITPFCDFVDRAVAHAQSYATQHSYSAEPAPTDAYYQEKPAQVAACQPPAFFPAITEPHAQVQNPTNAGPAPPAVAYKKLSEPLSEWVAGYVWKVCTTGMSLPSAFAQPSMDAGPYAVMPPSFLASSIHSLLLATLLQPSGVFLAIWYIVRLPVYFAAAPLSSEFVKERAFQSALFGDSYSGHDSTEGSAAFRLVVLGCMLANKWLDDHTFSNKTWHSISNIPLQTLNKLEALVLDIFSYDLSISSQQWSQWLAHVMSYHMSLSSPMYPQPISRPSSNPHSIVRGAIEVIIHAPSTRTFTAGLPQPVFLGIEDRIKERQEKESAMDDIGIDLDEDGPIREEYLPKRRASKLASQNGQARDDYSNGRGLPPVRALPPPAKWSPAGDEPILRNRNRSSGQYLAVRPSNNMMTSYPTNYHPHDVAYNNRGWNPLHGYVPIKSHTGYTYDSQLPVYHGQIPVYNPLAQIVPVPMHAHARSQSLSFDQELSRNNHMRSYSQSRFEYKQSDLLMMANEHVPMKDTAAKWMEQPNGYLCPSQAYIHIPSVGMQPTW
jgi:hypothetical protein